MLYYCVYTVCNCICISIFVNVCSQRHYADFAYKFD